jgi:hypothetical protein
MIDWTDERWENEALDEGERRRKAKERREEEIAARKKEQAELDATPLLEDEKALASALHELMCRWNHTDGCSWFYAKETDHDWNRDGARKSYIKMARKVIADGGDPTNVLKTLGLIEVAKKER